MGCEYYSLGEVWSFGGFSWEGTRAGETAAGEVKGRRGGEKSAGGRGLALIDMPKWIDD